MRTRVLAGILAAQSLIQGAALAQSFTATVPVPAIDRWVYPFASQPGFEPTIPIFAALREPGFDDRDAQFLLAFDTVAGTPAGLGSERYIVQRLTVTAVIANDERFIYDPTPDALESSYDPEDPEYIADADLGKPIELFAAGFRNGQSLATFTETSPFSIFPPFPPREGVRSVFAAVYDENDTAADISRQVRQKVQASPLAIGQTLDVQPGDLVPAGTTFTFDIDLSTEPAQRYFARAFDHGRLAVIITSLHPASGGPDGGGGGTGFYPAFFSKENAVAQANGLIASLEYEVVAYPGADFNLDGGVDGADIEAFFLAWEAAEQHADFNLDGGVDGADVAAFFEAWENG
ncbi:MAG: hypothetical protein KF864_01020 [Phycisphaeraceae bacterium]|nr:hypothetical protein [Phycisphaeraceae bacterium]